MLISSSVERIFTHWHITRKQLNFNQEKNKQQQQKLKTEYFEFKNPTWFVTLHKREVEKENEDVHPEGTSHPKPRDLFCGAEHLQVGEG